MRLEKERNDVVSFGKKMLTTGLTTSTGGNISIFNRDEGLIAISPSGIDYDIIKPEDVAVIAPDGTIVEGDLRPSTEMPMHLIHYGRRDDVCAVVHTHSIYAMTVGCLGWEIPALHYLVGFAGKKVPLAPYALFGSDELAQGTADAIGECNAVLMANHGLLALGQTINGAYAVAEIIEDMARVYYLTKCVGEPNLLSDEQMDTFLGAIANYGQH